MRRFRDVSRAVRRRETRRRARRWTNRTVRGAGGVDAEMMHLAVLGLTHLRMYGQTDGWMFLKCSTDRLT